MEQNTLTETKKLTGIQKNNILSTAKTLYREVYRRCNALQERIDKARVEAEAALEKKTAKLREELQELKDSKADYISRKTEELLCGYDIDDLVTYEVRESEAGKKSLFVNFKYPDTIYPTGDNAAAAPQFDGTGFEGTEKETMIDEALANGQPVPAEDREIDIDGQTADALVATIREAGADEANEAPVPGMEVMMSDAGNDFDLDAAQRAADEQEAREAMEAAEMEDMFDAPEPEDDDEDEDDDFDTPSPAPEEAVDSSADEDDIF